MKPPQRCTELLRTPFVLRAAHGAQLVIGAVWIWSSLIKIMDLDAFRRTITDHGVVTAFVDRWALGFPFVELAIGFMLAVLGSRRVAGAARGWVSPLRLSRP